MKKTAVFFAVLLFAFIVIGDMLSGKAAKEEQAEKKPSYTGMGSIEVMQEGSYRPLNFEKQRAMWFTAMDYEKIMNGKTEEEFETEVKERFEKAVMLGINTVYVQVRAYCDAYYDSELFPPGKSYTDTSYDPLEIMISTAHAYGLSFHAWINPLRGMKVSEIKNADRSYAAAELCDSSFASEVDGRMWLNPAYEEVRELVCAGVREIIENYNVDGIHIDDYFYPTTDAEFDREAFENSGASVLGQWRMENTDKLVGDIYRTVKSENSLVLFGISPQGSIKQNTEVQFADVVKWTSEKGFCDYIVPQVYYGYENESSPFTAVVDEWKGYAASGEVKLVIGICTYKYGKQDQWAGKGIDEWVNAKDITSRQTRDIMSDESLDGIAFYSYASTFEDDTSSDIIMGEELPEIRESLVDDIF